MDLLDVELKAIRIALLKVDARVLDEDRKDFYRFILNELYNVGESPCPKEYYKVLLKEIRTIIYPVETPSLDLAQED